MIKNDDSSYTVNFYADGESKQEKIFSISYDNTRNHNVKISCEGKCANSRDDSKTERTIINVPYFDYKDQKIDTTIDKICYCDNNTYKKYQPDYYSENLDKSYMTLDADGDQFLADYYKKLYKSADGIKSFPDKLYFPA